VEGASVRLFSSTPPSPLGEGVLGRSDGTVFLGYMELVLASHEGYVYDAPFCGICERRWRPDVSSDERMPMRYL